LLVVLAWSLWGRPAVAMCHLWSVSANTVHCWHLCTYTRQSSQCSQIFFPIIRNFITAH
jgi:hypothetical protein